MNGELEILQRQCDQTWRNFTILATFLRPWRNILSQKEPRLLFEMTKILNFFLALSSFPDAKKLKIWTISGENINFWAMFKFEFSGN